MPLPHSLAELVATYMSPVSAPVFEDTSVEPLIDGKTYFTQLFDAIDKTKEAPDVVYLLNWGFDPAMTGPGPVEIGLLLADKAAKGVDVRVILTAGVHLQVQKVAGPFADNWDAANELRSKKIAGTTPLEKRVLLDWSGKRLLGTHHQKAAVVRSSAGLDAFVSGLDFLPGRFDERPHNELTWKSDLFFWVGEHPWGWHDVGVRLKGSAVDQVWENFRSRWVEAMTLPWRVAYEIVMLPLTKYPVPIPIGLMNPLEVEPEPPSLVPVPGEPSHGRSVQVLRSRYPYKWWPDEWSEAPAGAIHEVSESHRNAIYRAERFVYLEDQFLDDTPTLDSRANKFSLFDELLAAAKRGVKLIFVGSGLSDPGDIPAGFKNATFEEAGGIRKKLLPPLPEPGEPAPNPADWAPPENIAVTRLLWTTVHAKVMIVDDEFASIGSANMHSRSMYGVDSELQVAVVDANSSVSSVVRKLRIDLWAEHLRLTPAAKSTLMPQLEDLDLALGIWRASWLPAGVDPDTWRKAGHPPGFATDDTAFSPVGPGP